MNPVNIAILLWALKRIPDIQSVSEPEKSHRKTRHKWLDNQAKKYGLETYAERKNKIDNYWKDKTPQAIFAKYSKK